MRDPSDTVEGRPPSGETVDGFGRREEPALHELRPGDALGRFRITALLGAGGMGRVFRARDPDLGRDLAIKVMHPGPRESGGLERLLREAQAMARLKHENLPIVYDVSTERGEVFIAFEFIDGMTLARWAEKGRSLRARLDVLTAAGDALEAAHAAGIIHRDFKPDNVLVGHDGSVKVVDFGLARGVDSAHEPKPARRDDALSVDLTVSGSILGTPAPSGNGATRPSTIAPATAIVVGIPSLPPAVNGRAPASAS